jgi:hypothetical protein
MQAVYINVIEITRQRIMKDRRYFLIFSGKNMKTWKVFRKKVDDEKV